MRIRTLVAALALLLVCPSVRAQELDADTEAARRHYELGRTLYEQARYIQACAEFANARRIQSLPALDYNIAKCEERVEHWDRAIAAYRRFLEMAPSDPNAPEVRARIDMLLQRTDSAQREEQRRRRHKLGIAALSLGGTAVLVGALGFVAYYAPWSRYAHERSVCLTNGCDPSQYTALTRSVHAAQDASDTLAAVGGALALAGIGVAIVWGREGRKTSIAPVAIGGPF